MDGEEKHAVDAFLASIALSLKSLNPIFLNQAKSSIFSIVQEYEMKQLMGHQDKDYMGNRITPNLHHFSPRSSSGSVSTPSPSPHGEDINNRVKTDHDELEKPR